MYFFDLGLVLKFWFILFLLGIIFLPITNRLFSIFVDKGYIFSKIIALISFSYLLFLLGTLKLLPFSIISFILILIIYLAVYFFITGWTITHVLYFVQFFCLFLARRSSFWGSFCVLLLKAWRITTTFWRVKHI